MNKLFDDLEIHVTYDEGTDVTPPLSEVEIIPNEKVVDEDLGAEVHITVPVTTINGRKVLDEEIEIRATKIDELTYRFE